MPGRTEGRAEARVFGQLCRCLAVTVLGAVLDFGLGLALVKLAGFSPELGSVVGFLAAVALNYVLHACWTFAGTGGGLGVATAGGYLASSAATLATRLVVLRLAAATDLPHLLDRDAERLAMAFGVSFCVNFAICRFLVFRHASACAAPAGERP